MKEIIIDVVKNQVAVFNNTKQTWERCSFSEACIESNVMCEIVENMMESENLENEYQVIFVMNLTDCEGKSNVCNVTLESGNLTIRKGEEDITENFNVDGWTRNENGEYTI